MPELTLRGGEVDGLSLHYVVAGPRPRRRPPPRARGLRGVVARTRSTRLATRATVFALDLPGFGRSAKPRTTYRLGYFARALHGFLDAMGIAQASLVGHSLGRRGGGDLRAHASRPRRAAGAGGRASCPASASACRWGYRLIALPVVGEALSLCGRAARLQGGASPAASTRRAPAEVEFLVEHDYATRTGAEARAAWLATARHIRADFVDHRADYRRAIAHARPAGAARARPSGSRRVPPRTRPRRPPACRAPRCAGSMRCGHFPQLEHAAGRQRLARRVPGRPAGATADERDQPAGPEGAAGSPRAAAAARRAPGLGDEALPAAQRACTSPSRRSSCATTS